MPGQTTMKKLAPSLRIEFLAELEDAPEQAAVEDSKSSLVRQEETDTTLVRTYRALSATCVRKSGVNIDFGHDPEVLKAAVDKFSKFTTGHKLPVFKDHSRSVDAWIGCVEDAYWEDSATLPGINQVIAYDKSAAGTPVIQGVKTGGLNSVSVTIDFQWKKSHPSMKDGDFLTSMAQNSVVDGAKVCIQPTVIDRLMETSLVWQGADSSAKAKNAFEADGLYERFQEDGMDKVIQFINELHGSDLSWTEDAVETSLKLVKDTLEAKKSEFEKAQIELQAQLGLAQAETVKARAELAAKARIADSYSTGLKNRLTAAAAMVLDIQGAELVMETASLCQDMEKLEALTQVYERRAEELIPLKCQKCGCTDVSRRSSSASAAEIKPQEAQLSGEGKSLNDVITNFRKKK